jgi:L-asparaginase/beta-aspartyl-peptidase (threonine type)
MLCGEGAIDFARRCGFEDWYKPSAHAHEAYERIRTIIRDGRKDELREAWRTFDLKRYWNFAQNYDEVLAPATPRPAKDLVGLSHGEGGCDTIGAVAVDRDGRLAVANSTGGASPMLRGRVGDSPIVGCGFYAGPAAAVAATGVGEEIVRRQLCRQVYDWISQGDEVARAVERGVTQCPKDIPIGLIAINRRGRAQANNRSMAWSENVS